MPFKLIYTGEKFNWGPAENGYFLSMMGFTRVIVLLGLLPLLIRLFRPTVPLPNRARPQGSDSEPSVRVWEKEAKALRIVADSHFDVFLARCSVLLDGLSYVTLASNGGSEVRFLTGAALQSLGGGAGPAIQSLALAHAAPRDAGRLFASMGVLQTITSSILGPLLFNAVYSRTSMSWPECMLWLAVGLYGVALAMLLLVRLHRRVEDVEAGVAVEAESAAAEAAPKVQKKKSAQPVSRPGQERGRSETRREGNNSGISLRD